ncbi:MAG TPA: SRPBCC family protein [Candidatus Sulfopaludibacter sp.]|nr:SRPBCC family protein [Candidatus Sulfopaludibacter sp.]
MPPKNGSAGASPMKMAKALGWFSIGLGVTEIVAPGLLSKMIGTRRRSGTMRLMGLREVAAGIGILSSQRPGPWLWARVGGDFVDLAALASAEPRAKGRLSTAIGAVAGVTVLDAMCAQRFASASSTVHFTASTIINRSPDECYRYWRDITKLPTFIEHLKSVRMTGENRSHWVTQSPVGQDLEWDAEITEDTPGKQISWRSLEGSQFPNWGRVRFEEATGGRGTLVRLLMNYDAAAHPAAPFWIALLGADPGMRVRRDLLRFKQLMETGEIATTEGQPAGRRSSMNWLDRAVKI